MAPPTRVFFFFGLNAVRFLSIVSLLLVFSSGIFVMVTNIKAVNAFQANIKNGNETAEEFMDCDYIDGSTVPNQPAGVFWAVVSGLLIIFQVIILLLSECSWPMAFFDRFFPVLGSNFGLGALGIFQCLIGAQILSHHVDDFTLVAAFFLFSVGCLNMLLGLIFRESAKQRRSVRVWRSDSKPILPTISTTNGSEPIFVNVTSYQQQSASEYGFGVGRSSTEKSGMGFGRQGEKVAGLRGFILQKPEETLPRYVMPTAPPPTAAATPDKPESIRSSTSSFASPVYPHDSDHDEERRPRFKSSSTAL